MGVALWDCSATGHSCQVQCGLQMGDMGHGLEVGIYLGPVWVVYGLFFFSFFLIYESTIVNLVLFVAFVIFAKWHRLELVAYVWVPHVLYVGKVGMG